MKTVTWGILGLGKIAEKFAAAVNSLENTALVCASRTEEKAAAFAARHHAKRYYGSYQQLVEDAEVDIIYVATPMLCHYEDVKLCLLHGKNVLCEKSVTVNARQWSELSALAKSRGLFLMEAMWTKCLPSYRTVKAWLAQGKIGKPRVVHAQFNNLCPYDETDRLYKLSLGGGSLLDIGVYVLTFACDLLGYAPAHMESGMQRLPDGVDVFDTMLLRYPDGAIAALTATFSFSSENMAYILGERGSIQIGPWFHQAEHAALLDASGQVQERFDTPFSCNGYEYEILEAQRCLAAGLTESPLVPHGETLAIMQHMDTIRRQHGLIFPDTPYEEMIGEIN